MLFQPTASSEATTLCCFNQRRPAEATTRCCFDQRRPPKQQHAVVSTNGVQRKQQHTVVSTNGVQRSNNTLLFRPTASSKATTRCCFNQRRPAEAKSLQISIAIKNFQS
jgi:hypothetical protein